VLLGETRKLFGYFCGSISRSTTPTVRFGTLKRARIGVVASDSPELVGPKTASTLTRAASSVAAFTALVGSPCVSRVTTSIFRPFTPPAALILFAAYTTPRL
jgi:hypothetical protein